MANVKHFNINGTVVDVCDDEARALAQTASSTASQAKATAESANTKAEQALENSGGSLSYESGTETITWTQGGA